MGIDARILVRLKSGQPTPPSDEQLARWSWDIANSLGANKFFITDGLPSAEYKVAHERWHAAFNAHRLYPEYEKGGKAREAVHKTILDDVGPYPKELRRAIELAPDYADDDAERVPLGKAYYQDGDTLFADEGEWFLRVNVWTRYYGIGYERGDLMFLCAVAEWIEANIPNAEVWYGGDSSGCEAEPFSEEERRKLRAHLFSKSGRDYFDHEPNYRGPKPAACGLCVKGETQLTRFGWGGGGSYIALNCGGCGKNFVTRDSGATWVTEEEKE